MKSDHSISTNRIKLPRSNARKSRLPSLLNAILHPTGYLVPASFLILTTLTATVVGARYMFDFRNDQFPVTSGTDLMPYRWAWNHFDLLASGLPFALTILVILLAHEFGHFFACRYFDIDAALPVIFPFPLLTGTLGGRVDIRSRIKSRAALLIIGAAGPIAGFTVAFAAACGGMIYSSSAGPRTLPSQVQLAAPGIIRILRSTLLASYPDIPSIEQMVPHPVLLASWIGCLMTALSLLPVGRLDGGNIVYAISPRLHRVTSVLTGAALLYLGTVEWVGWLVWAWLLMLPSVRRPNAPEATSLGVEWLALAPICLGILVVTITSQPIIGMSLVQVLLRTR